MVRQRVKETQQERQTIRDMDFYDMKAIFKKIENKVAENAGIKVQLDSATDSNIMFDADGTLKYIDLVMNHASNFKFDTEKVLRYFDSTRVSNPNIEKTIEDRRKLIWSLRRIKELGIIDKASRFGYKVEIINAKDWEGVNEKQKERVIGVINGLHARFRGSDKDTLESPMSSRNTIRTIRN